MTDVADALQIPLTVLVFLAADNERLVDLSETQAEHLSRGIRELMGNVSSQKKTRPPTLLSFKSQI